MRFMFIVKTAHPGPPTPELVEAINELSEREKIVVTLYYFEGLTLAEIGYILGVTESRVCQIHTKAVGGLRGQMTEYD